MRNLLRIIISRLYWMVNSLVHGYHVQSYSVGLRAKLGKRVIIRKGSEIGSAVKIGDYSYISGPRAYVEAADIGKFCSIARATTIGVSDHNHQSVTTHPFIRDPFYGLVDSIVLETQKHSPIIGNDVWIGMGSFVMRGVTIGDGAVVAANSVVTKNIAPYSIVAGSPARHIKYRFNPDIIDALLLIKWWDWDNDKIQKNLDDFKNIDNFVKKHHPN